MKKQLSQEEIYCWSKKIDEAKNDKSKLEAIRKCLLAYCDEEHDENVKKLVKRLKR